MPMRRPSAQIGVTPSERKRTETTRAWSAAAREPLACSGLLLPLRSALLLPINCSLPTVLPCLAQFFVQDTEHQRATRPAAGCKCVVHIFLFKVLQYSSRNLDVVLLETPKWNPLMILKENITVWYARKAFGSCFPCT